MITEFVRLLITLATTAAGFQIAAGPWSIPGLDPQLATVWGAVLGAGIGYVIGGVAGRRVERFIDGAPGWFENMTGPQVIAGGAGLAVGTVLGAALGAPLVALLPPAVGWPLAILVVVVLASTAGGVFASKAGEFGTTRSVGNRRDGERAYLIDSSAAIDGRVLELSRSGLLPGALWVPAFVLDELQTIADSADRERRRRGRRGLDVLEALRTERDDLVVVEDTVPERDEVDAKLLVLAERYGAMLVTTDHNLSRAAGLRGITTINPHSLGEALRPMLATGEHIELLISRPGSEPGQGVGYLEDGTMVVVSEAADSIGEMLEVEISNMVRTSVGRMFFARPTP